MDDPVAQEKAVGGKQVRRRRGWLWAGGALLLLGGGIWLLRGSIANRLVADQMAQRDVQASYRIDDIGLITHRLSNVVIGDPRRPDLIARRVELDIGWSWQGPVVDAVRASGVRLYGRWDGQRLRLGEVDKLLPPPSDKAFELPDLALRLEDARARIDTPWGAIGARVEGRGPLRRNFSGTVALTAEALSAGGCTVTVPSAFGNIRTDGGALRFAGPIRLARLACPDRAIVAGKTDLKLDAALTADASRWSGRIDGNARGISAAGSSAGSLVLSADFSGNAAGSSADYRLTAAQLSVPNGQVAQAVLAGQAKLTGGAFAAAADLTIRRAGIEPGLRRQWARALAAGGTGNPLAALGDRYGRAALAALANVSGEAKLDVADQVLTLSAPQLGTASGATLRSDAATAIRLTLGEGSNAWTVQGRARLAGGGLPQASLDVRAGQGGALSGMLALATLSVGDSRLALSPIRFDRRPGGTIRLASRGLYSGPLAGGRVEGLGLGIDAVIDPAGAVSLSGGCRRLTLAGASIAGARLGTNALQLCAAPGRPLLAWRGGRLSGEIALPALQLSGRTGETPFTLRAARGAVSLGSLRWGLDALNVAVGSGEEGSNFTAARIDGAPGGLSGRIEGGAGEIGTIPLMMTAIAGDWRWAKGALTLNGGLTVSDQQAPPRFNPQVSEDVMLTFADGKIEATANFAEQETRTPIGRADLRHRFADGIGSVDLLIMSMRFNAAFQPEQLTPLALGVIANADGTLAGRGRIDWTPDGVTSTGTFTTAGSNFAAAFGSVSGASTTLVFDDLLGLRSAPGQRISLDEVNPGFPVYGGTIDYQLLDATRFRIEGGRWPFAGGELILKPTTLDFDENAVRRLEFELRGVDAAVFLTELGFENVNASGVFDGVLPVEFSGLGGRIVDGRLVARPGGGQVAYVGELSNYNLGPLANFAFNMLKSLRYKDMIISLNGDLDGEMATEVKIVGLKQGDGASRNLVTRQIEKLPIIFNVRINAPFRQLISSAKSLYDPSLLIDQNLPALIAAEKARNEPPVQPAESETVP